MNIPQPPKNSTNEELRASLTNLIIFINYLINNGNKVKSFSQTEIDNIDTTKLASVGTILLNETDGKLYGLEIDGGVITKKRLTT